MRQAVTTIIAVSFLVISPAARANDQGLDAGATIAQARRLIDAKDYSPATELLEDLLPETNATDRQVILELLRQTYGAMAREAKAAGRDREAAHLLDNLAIIARMPGLGASTKPTAETPRKPAPPQQVPADTTAQDAPARVLSPLPSRNVSLVGSAQQATPAVAPAPPPPEPAPVAEPVKTPEPQALPLLPGEITSPSSRDSSAGGTQATPPLSHITPSRDPAGPSRAPPVSADVVGSKSPSPETAPEAPGRADSPKPATDGPTLEEGDRLFAAGKYLDAGRCYAALARQNRLPTQRTQHWAYCRMVDVARKINLRPRSPREWDEIEAEIVRVQRLSPNIWYGEYLRSKVAEVRKNGRRPLAKSDNLIVRGTAPDESQSQPESPPRRFPRLFGNGRGTPAKAAAGCRARGNAASRQPRSFPGRARRLVAATGAIGARAGPGQRSRPRRQRSHRPVSGRASRRWQTRR